jgi:hypothetical protein
VGEPDRVFPHDDKAKKMSKREKSESAVMKYMLDRQLDQELEDTFPASDALKVTRTPHRMVLHEAVRDRQPVEK